MSNLMICGFAVCAAVAHGLLSLGFDGPGHLPDLTIHYAVTSGVAIGLLTFVLMASGIGKKLNGLLGIIISIAMFTIAPWIAFLMVLMLL